MPDAFRLLKLGDVRSALRVEHGSHHLVWEVQTTLGRFAVRPGARRGHQAGTEHESRERLWRSAGHWGIAPEYHGGLPVRTPGFNGWLEVFTWIEGRHLNPSTDAEIVADALARLHGRPLRGVNRAPRHAPLVPFLRAELQSYQRRNTAGDPISSLLRAETRLALHTLRGRAESRVESSVVHNDLVDRNVLIQHGRAWLIDWDWALISSPVVDLFGFLSPFVRSWRRTPRFVSLPAARRFISAYGLHYGTRRLRSLMQSDGSWWRTHNVLLANWLHRETQLKPHARTLEFYRRSFCEVDRLEGVIAAFKE